MGQSRRFGYVGDMSVHPSIADMRADIKLRRYGPIATQIDVRSHVGNEGRSGLVVLTGGVCDELPGRDRRPPTGLSKRPVVR